MGINSTAVIPRLLRWGSSPPGRQTFLCGQGHAGVRAQSEPAWSSYTIRSWLALAGQAPFRSGTAGTVVGSTPSGAVRRSVPDGTRPLRRNPIAGRIPRARTDRAESSADQIDSPRRDRSAPRAPGVISCMAWPDRREPSNADPARFVGADINRISRTGVTGSSAL